MLVLEITLQLQTIIEMICIAGIVALILVGKPRVFQKYVLEERRIVPDLLDKKNKLGRVDKGRSGDIMFHTKRGEQKSLCGVKKISILYY